ncbi:hypothetical protein [Streptomyces mutomycini]|uniref:hypothetical protein n=1 Tax=Streptomyces mutomycini TaxID=284036 RepID=UPI0033EAF90B
MIVLWLAIVGGYIAFEAWITMLLIGAIHSNVSEVPDFNYWGAFFLVLLANVLVGSAVGAGKAGE